MTMAPSLSALTGAKFLPRLGRRTEERESFTRLPRLPMKGA